jgi:exodeoxyribonuclease VII large subunit
VGKVRIAATFIIKLFNKLFLYQRPTYGTGLSLGIELKEGLEVKIQGYPDVYPMSGQLKFKADVITPIGEGALKLAFEKLKKELEAQGYFRQDRKQQLPQHIERIGLITSESGVVIRDFLTGL